MKVFEYNLNTNRRGALLGERSICSGHGSGTIKCINDSEWITLDEPSAVDSRGNSINASQYNVNAICFCIGKMVCGTDTIWSWVISK